MGLTDLNYLLYQAGWFACVLGAAWGRPWTGLAFALALTGVHLALSRERAIEARLALLAVAVGVLVESFQITAGTYRLSSGTLVDGLAPLWLLAMWGQFATTFRYSMRSVMTRPIRAALFGAAGGPVAFLAGARLGAVTLLPPLASGLVRLSFAWAIALIILAAVARRELPAEAPAPRYRGDDRR
jgi:hypothetical protein